MNTEIALSFVNRALVDLGEQPIASFDDTTTAARVAKVRYPSIVSELLSASRWEFASTQQQLARLTTPVPLFEWANAFTMPTAPPYIRMARVARSADTLHSFDSFVWPRARRVDYGIRANAAGDRLLLYSNWDEVFVEYIGRVEESLFPPAFQACVVTYCRKAFAQALTDDEEKVGQAHLELHGDGRRAGQLGRAIHQDRLNSPKPGLVHDFGFISGR